MPSRRWRSAAHGLLDGIPKALEGERVLRRSFCANGIFWSMTSWKG